jgi:hypothetical protein
MRRALLVLAMLCGGWIAALHGQVICRQSSVVCSDNRQLTTDDFQDKQRASFIQGIVHTGKWLTAAAAIGLTVMASNQHGYSRRDWDALMEICRSASDACVVGPDGRYLRADAEALYQSSRHYDLLANRWLVGAQLSLVTTTALFIIDLNAGNGPQNIPYPSQIRVGAVPGGSGVGLAWTF